MKPPVLDDGAKLVPSEVSLMPVSLCFRSDLYSCHMSQQSTCNALVPFVEMKSQHWLYPSAIDPLSPWSMCSPSLCLLCQLSRPCWRKADMLRTPSVADCLRSDASLHSSACSLSPLAFLFSSSLSLSLSVRGACSPALSAGNCQVQLCVFKIAYMAGSCCKMRPCNTSYSHTICLATEFAYRYISFTLLMYFFGLFFWSLCHPPTFLLMFLFLKLSVLLCHLTSP